MDNIRLDYTSIDEGCACFNYVMAVYNEFCLIPNSVPLCNCLEHSTMCENDVIPDYAEVRCCCDNLITAENGNIMWFAKEKDPKTSCDFNHDHKSDFVCDSNNKSIYDCRGYDWSPPSDEDDDMEDITRQFNNASIRYPECSQEILSELIEVMSI
jgi:hypothetical protein